MNETKHTPGPWSYRYRYWAGDRDNSPLDVYAITADMANVTIGETKFSCSDDEANARLIAAAPDLLEILKEISERMKRYGSGDVVFHSKVMAAIAKAEGKS